MLKLELSIKDKLTIIPFSYLEEVYEFCEMCLPEDCKDRDASGYVFASNGEVICNFHGTKEECLKQIRSRNIDFY